MLSKEELIENISYILEPTLWDSPQEDLRAIGCPNANIDGLKLCVKKKAERLIDLGVIKNGD